MAGEESEHVVWGDIDDVTSSSECKTAGRDVPGNVCFLDDSNSSSSLVTIGGKKTLIEKPVDRGYVADPAIGSSAPDPNNPRLPSVGSKQHSAKACSPCVLLLSTAGCKAGASCNYCHMPHPPENKRNRPSKLKRERYKQLIQRGAGRTKADDTKVSL
eukprot:TRINITY_DN75312_c0_g1_i1.p1 TRINITY_DN75312_c0_g1~~TRINITY_DN75312_c0_g1_i1.p1  ORF type:complete len:169 (+),score=23.61 TRINITY_DN75312_c0_g1_i1:36-509(+)